MKNILRLSPLVVVFGILSYTWYTILTTDCFATTKHYVALMLFMVCINLCFINFNAALILAGIFLFLASFNIIAIFPEIKSSSYFVRIGSQEFATPSIQWATFAIFLCYMIINISYFVNMGNPNKY